MDPAPLADAATKRNEEWARLVAFANSEYAAHAAEMFLFPPASAGVPAPVPTAPVPPKAGAFGHAFTPRSFRIVPPSIRKAALPPAAAAAPYGNDGQHAIVATPTNKDAAVECARQMKDYADTMY
jgi:hypothetical protein